MTTKQIQAVIGMAALAVVGAFLLGKGLTTDPTYGGGFSSQAACEASVGFSMPQCDVRDSGSLDGGEVAAGAVMVIGAMGAIWYFNFTPSGRATWTGFTVGRARKRSEKNRIASARARFSGQSLSQVGIRGPAGLACPNCTGTQFTTGRPTAGIYGSTGRRSQVTCVTCGVVFRQG